MGSKILGYNIYNDTKKNLINHIDEFEKLNIISGNPEVLMNGLKDERLNKSFKSKYSLIIPDGVGTVVTSRMVKQPVKEKIAGIEVMQAIIEKCEKEDLSIYLIGTKQNILEKCVLNLKRAYPKIKIAGYHNGYLDIDNCKEVIDEIISKKPYALFVAMGSPKQEQFLEKYMEILPCKIFMGVGGSFDIIAGELKRAPRWMIRLGIEWLYRVCKEPYRIIRLTSIPVFMFKAICSSSSRE